MLAKPDSKDPCRPIPVARSGATAGQASAAKAAVASPPRTWPRTAVVSAVRGTGEKWLDSRAFDSCVAVPGRAAARRTDSARGRATVLLELDAWLRPQDPIGDVRRTDMLGCAGVPLPHQR